jgi:hypothetical protein
MSAEERLKRLGIVLPKVPTPVANYMPYRLAGNLLFLSGRELRGEQQQSHCKVGARFRRWMRPTALRRIRLRSACGDARCTRHAGPRRSGH